MQNEKLRNNCPETEGVARLAKISRFFMDAGVALDKLIKQTADAHLRRSEVCKVIEETLIAGGVEANQSRVARERLMRYIAPMREGIVTKPRKNKILK